MPRKKPAWSAPRFTVTGQAGNGEQKPLMVWATASRAHLNLDFQFNSQPLTVAFTEQASIGGRAWPNVIFDEQAVRLCLRCVGQQHTGSVEFLVALQSPSLRPGKPQRLRRSPLPVLDFRCLTDEQLLMAEDRSSTSSATRTFYPPTSPTPTPTAPSSIAASSAISSASTRTSTKPSAASPPNGAPSRQSTAARSAQRALNW